MYEDDHAHQAAGEYLGHIQRHLKEHFGSRRLTILDAGCQAGRILIPLAQGGHRLIGVDTSGLALNKAQHHAKLNGLSVAFHRGNISGLRRWVAPESLDVAICTEVLYLCKDYRELLKLMAESVKRGGLLCISHRTVLFYAAAAFRRGHPEDALSVVRRAEGPLPDGDYYNWQTQEELNKLYQSCNLPLLGSYPVDHSDIRIDTRTIADAEIRELLEPVRGPDSTFRIPAYTLIIVKKN